MKDVFAVILAGGSGTRFWPMSRRNRPKQFLPLVSNQALIADTLGRLKGLVDVKNTLVVCGKSHATAVKQALKGLPAKNVIVEPAPRNTAPALGLAALMVSQKNPKAVILAVPADHAVHDPDAFRATLQTALDVARSGRIATLGIRPVRPETGYGYIRRGLPLQTKNGRVHEVKTFVEKPDSAHAQAFLATGEYLWNAGIFAFRADVMLDEIKAHMPKLHAILEIIGPRLRGSKGAATLAREFPKADSMSIDYGIMEKSQRAAVVEAAFGWSDVGSYAALSEVRAPDHDGNVIEGKALTIASRANVIISRGKRLIVVYGITGQVIVDTGDVLLIIPRDRSQDVKKVVEEIEKRGFKELL